jgi:aryl-alcohol dehydrogenase-like predicted oxidoreductase
MRRKKMTEHAPTPLADRRRFLRMLAIAGVAGRTLLDSRDARAAVYAAKTAAGADVAWPEMQYQQLGRTGFRASRLVFGCGAALSRSPKDALLDAAWDAGINVFDVGFRGYYGDAEQNLAPFLKKHRDRIFLISKAQVPLELEPDAQVSVAQAREGAAGWLAHLDDSLRELRVERVDAYYLMASYNASLIASEEIHTAFQKAKQAGKVGHLGLSTHQNAERVLETAAASGGYDLAMIAITPAGWYDWADKTILPGTKPMTGLRPLLERVRASGMGLVGMKAGRYIAGRKFLGWGKPDAFDAFYGEKLLASGLSPYQRSYAFVLAHGLDCVNADMQSFAHLQENVAAAARSPELLA